MKDRVIFLCKKLRISPLLGRFLVNRGVMTPIQAEQFLYPKLENLYSPFLFSEMRKACQRVRRALLRGEGILIFGDRDVDGITSMAILIRLLQALKGKISYYIPDNFAYGLEKRVIQGAKRKGIKLIILVDCGITDMEETKYANSLGIDIIIIDHHEPIGGRWPNAFAVLNPKIDPQYPWNGLSSSGIAFKFGQALLASYDHEDIAQDLSHPIMNYYFRGYLDLASLGIFADNMPLVNENRIFAKYGLRYLKYTGKVGFKILLHSFGLGGLNIFEREVNFKLSPLLNAAGRMNQSHLALKLLTIKNKEKAAKIANDLFFLNKERRKKVELDTALAIEYVENEIDLSQERILIIPLPEREPGVTGIVANRLVKRYRLPTIVFARKDAEAVGSARAPRGMDILSMLLKCKDLYTSFGGHKGAVGLRLRWENVEKLRRHLNEVAKDFDYFVQKYKIEAELTQDEITHEFLSDLDKLRPFGEANPSPLLLLRNIRPLKIERMRNGGEHIKLIIPTKATELEVIGWKMRKALPPSLIGADLLGRMEKEILGRKERIRFFVEKILPKR